MKSRHFIGLFMIGIMALANNPMAKTVECEHTVAITKTNKTLNAYKGGDAAILTPVGKGIDLSSCGLFAYDSRKVQKDVFDRTWLNDFYSNGFYDVSNNRTVSAVVSEENVYSTTQSLMASEGLGAFLDASLPYVEVQAKAEMGFSTSYKRYNSEDSIIFNAQYNTYSFDYSLPAFGSYSHEYLNHLSSDFLSSIDEISRAMKTALYKRNKSFIRSNVYNLFKEYGTDVLWKAGFGGACDILYWARSKDKTFDSETRMKVTSSLTASVEQAVSLGVSSSFSLAEILGSSYQNVTSKLTGKFVGGKPGSVSVAYSLPNLAATSKGWTDTIEDYPAVLSYLDHKPIWEILPDSYEAVATVLADFYKDYLEDMADSYQKDADDPMLPSGTLYDTHVELEGSQSAVFYDRATRKNLNYSINLDEPMFYNIDTLKAAGYKKVNIQPSFDLYEVERGTTVGINIKFGEGGNRIVETPKNVDLANDIVTHWSLDSLGMGEIWMTLDELQANPYIYFKFATNNRGGFLLLEERAAKLSNFKIKVYYKK